MKRAMLALAGGCSLLVNHAESQCSTQADCDTKFPGRGTVCDQGGCVAKLVTPVPDGAVAARQSELLAAAIADGNLSITRTTGAEPSAGTPSIPLDRSGSPDAAGS